MNIQKRLTILTTDEINQLYSRPLFTTKERVQYFSLSQMETELLYTLRSIKSKIYFILQLGYFKSKHLFFQFNLCEVKDDIQYILKVHFNDADFSDFGSIDKKTRLNQQQLILKRFNYCTCDSQSRLDLKEQARRAAAVSGKPIFIFRELINYLTTKQIIIPGYSFIQEVIGNAITYEQKRLIRIIQNQLSEADKKHLKELLYNSSGLYKITRIKHEPKDFNMNEIKREIEYGKEMYPLFQLANSILPQGFLCPSPRNGGIARNLVPNLFSPRIADIGSSTFWRMDGTADYGDLNTISRHKIRTDLIGRYWDDFMRIAGSLQIGKVNPTQLIQALQRGGKPTMLGRAIRESRHSLARALMYGKKGDFTSKLSRGARRPVGSIRTRCECNCRMEYSIYGSRLFCASGKYRELQRKVQRLAARFFK